MVAQLEQFGVMPCPHCHAPQAMEAPTCTRCNHPIAVRTMRDGQEVPRMVLVHQPEPAEWGTITPEVPRNDESVVTITDKVLRIRLHWFKGVKGDQRCRVKLGIFTFQMVMETNGTWWLRRTKPGLEHRPYGIAKGTYTTRRHGRAQCYSALMWHLYQCRHIYTA